MSGGRLVVLDRAGRDVKQYPLAEGLATLGTDPACDIRVMLPTVSPHHATVIVHANQTVVQSVSEGETLVNGVAVSVAALRHNDVIALGGRHLRWEYTDPHVKRPLAAQPALCRGGRGGRSKRARPSEPAARNTLINAQRASMPASTSMKQVAIVQPQRRETGSSNDDKTENRSPVPTTRRQDNSVTNEQIDTQNTPENTTRKSTRSSPKSPQASTTKASQWIESRKSNRPSLTPARRTLTPKQTRDTVTPKQTRSNTSISEEETKTPNTVTPIRTRSLTPSQKASLTTNLTRSTRASLTPTQTRISTRISLTPNQTRSLTRVSLTPNQTRNLSRTSLTPNQSRTPRVRVSVKRSTITPIRASEKKENLRMAVLKRNTRPVKIEAPTSIDHTKQAAIMLMTRHTKSKSPNTNKVTYVVKKPSPVRKTPKTTTRNTPRGQKIGVTPKRASTYSQGPRKSSIRNSSVSVLEINDSDTSIYKSRLSRRSKVLSLEKSPPLPNPRKSALKNPKNTSRKTESIKFDLSNLENETGHTDIVTINTTNMSNDSVSDISLHYSDTSIKSPSPRRPIYSRSSRIIEKTLGSPMNQSTEETVETLTPTSPRSRNATRTSMIVQKALEQSNTLRQSRRFTKMSEQSWSTTLQNQTKTQSPRASNVESYSIVDLVSVDSNRSEYNSANSTPFGTPRNNSRQSRSLNLALPSSTPYTKAQKAQTPQSDSKISVQSASMITPENDENFRPFNSTRVSKASRSRSRINDSDLLLLDDDESPRTSKRTAKSTTSPFVPKSLSVNISNQDGTITPENVPNNEECTTPVLSIQSLLDSSQGSFTSQKSVDTRNRITNKIKRKTIGVIRSTRKQDSLRSKSFNVRSSRRNEEDSGTITPTSAFKPEQEGVKNKHSTAKKPLSKRSIIDNLNESDIVKQLFNSPVKRKLSQSMTEFSKRQLFEDDEVVPRKQTRQTTALTGRTPDNSFLEQTHAVTPDVFVSPLTTPSNSPNLEGIKRLFAKNTPENDLRNVRGVKGLLRTPRNRKSVKNDLTNVSGVKATFAKSPRNRLSDVRIKELYIPSPKNDLRRVTGVKTIFKFARKQRTPKNTLEDVRGVKNLYKRSPRNDLRNASGVKDALQIRSPRNDLSDVRGVKRMFRLEKQKYQSDVSGIEELFHETNLDNTFDLLMGKPPLRTYSKSSSAQKAKPKVNTRKTIPIIGRLELTTDVAKWLEERREEEERNKKYNEHTLPIKKRSLVNKSGNESKVRLPIKKRVVHSTPVKGQNATMNASELGRVSPIALANTYIDTTVGTSQMIETTTRIGKEDSKVAKKRSTKTTRSEISVPSPSPRKTRASKTQAVKVIKSKGTKAKQKTAKQSLVLVPENSKAQVSSNDTRVEARRTRRKANATPEKKSQRKSIPNTIKRRMSLVIPKKSPIARPQVNKKPDTSKETVAKKNTRQKTLKVAQVIHKPSPVKRTRKQMESVVESKPKRTRKNEAQSEDTTTKTKEVKTRGKKGVVEKTTEVKTKRGRKQQEQQIEEPALKKTNVKDAKPKRTRRQTESEDKTAEVVEKLKRGRKTNNNKTIEEQKPKQATRNTRNKKDDNKEETKNTRNKKVDVKEETKTTRNKADVKEMETKRSKRVDTSVPTVSRVKDLREKLVKTQSADAVEPRRTRRQVESEVPVKPRGKKVQFEDTPPAEGRKRKINTSPVKETTVKAKKMKAAANSPVQPRQTRGKAVTAQKTTRARKR